jgi:chromate transport protein ChrA
VAFGATVLVPSIFAIIACAYALSTLTDNVWVIAPVSLVWAFIILTVDRALLATYRAYQGFFRKAAQFSLRMVVAALMGITISHPLTLLLFKDTISSVIEKHRQGRSRRRVRPPSSRKSPSRRASPAGSRDRQAARELERDLQRQVPR